MCVQILLPNALLHDIVRMPVLVAHYFNHIHSDGHIHFTDFIADHYADNEHHDTDQDDHGNLPYHKHDINFQQHVFSAAVLDILPIVLANYDAINPLTKIISSQHFYSSTELSAIWRPPKFT